MVRYELRVDGKIYAGYDDIEGALVAAKHLIARDADLDTSKNLVLSAVGGTGGAPWPA